MLLTRDRTVGQRESEGGSVRREIKPSFDYCLIIFVKKHSKLKILHIFSIHSHNSGFLAIQNHQNAP